VRTNDDNTARHHKYDYEQHGIKFSSNNANKTGVVVPGSTQESPDELAHVVEMHETRPQE
jgi:hypothetical protein